MNWVTLDAEYHPAIFTRCVRARLCRRVAIPFFIAMAARAHAQSGWRRYIPSVWQLDSATLLLALLVELIYLALLLSLQGYPYSHFPLPGLLAWGVVKLLTMSVYFLMGALIAQAVLSWVNPHTPIAPMLQAITQRFLLPIRRVVPLLGNLDLSPLILLVICQILLLAPIAMLENMVLRLF
jgi:YggT family protein